jgi:hypothetical protein
VIGFLGGGDAAANAARNHPNSTILQNLAAGANGRAAPADVRKAANKAEKQQYQAASRNMFHNVSRDVP